MRTPTTAFLILVLATFAWADTDPLGDLAAKLREIDSKTDLTTAAKIEKIQKLRPITIKAKGQIADVTPTTVWIDVPVYRQNSRGQWIRSGTDHKEIPALQIDVTGDNLVITDSRELIGRASRSFTVSADSERKMAITWGKGDDVAWTEKVSVTDQGRLRADPVFAKLSDLTRTPKPEPAQAGQVEVPASTR